MTMTMVLVFLLLIPLARPIMRFVVETTFEDIRHARAYQAANNFKRSIPIKELDL